MELISRKDMLELLDSKEPCSIRYVTSDLKKMKGGSVKEFDSVVQTGYYKPTDSEEDKIPSQKNYSQPKKPLLKNPNHYDNATRNLKVKGGGTQKCCIFLITHINGKKVLP